jgi:DNA replication protein DnaC
MGSKQDDYNRGQKDGARAGGFDEFVESNFSLESPEYRKGFEHGRQQQVEARAKETVKIVPSSDSNAPSDHGGGGTGGGGGAMNQPSQALEHASVRQYCRGLRMPVIGANFVRLSEQAIKEQRSHIGYLEALLAMEAEERDRHAIQKRLRDAKLPRLKTLEEFDFNQARQIPAAKICELAEGGYIERAELVVFMGECGTGKTHLATGLCVAACRQKRRARFTTAANLVNELVEARQQNAVKRVLVRWLRYDVIVLDEVGYVPLAEIGAEFLFQVIAERAERAALIVTQGWAK